MIQHGLSMTDPAKMVPTVTLARHYATSELVRVTCVGGIITQVEPLPGAEPVPAHVDLSANWIAPAQLGQAEGPQPVTLNPTLVPAAKTPEGLRVSALYPATAALHVASVVVLPDSGPVPATVMMSMEAALVVGVSIQHATPAMLRAPPT